MKKKEIAPVRGSFIPRTPAKLYVISAISNPIRFEARYRHYHDFRKRIVDGGAELITVEHQHGHRPFAVTKSGRRTDVQLRGRDELWLKENLLNLGIAHATRLDPGARYFAWIDADVQFSRPDWAQETIEQLQHYDIVQMFSHAQDLGPCQEPLARHTGFVYAYVNGLFAGRDARDYAAIGHTGYAWAATREALDRVGGLIDFAILGAADKHMAMGLIGRIGESFRRDFGTLSSPYVRELIRWQDRAERHLRRNVGFVPGTLLHYWHGRKADRRYRERWQILIDHNYDPDNDIRRDAQGVIALNDTDDPRQRELRDSLRAYFRQRNEDTIDA